MISFDEEDPDPPKMFPATPFIDYVVMVLITVLAVLCIAAFWMVFR